MAFSSIEFLFLFLPISVIVYFALPKKARNFGLLAVSLVFYAWGDPKYLPLIIFTAVFNYICGYFIGRCPKKGKYARALLAFCILLNILSLAIFKYADFIIENLARIPTLSALSPLGLTLPVGISFYTFQSVSYVVDVYREDAKAQNDPIKFGAYLTMFPQLVAGPIVRYSDVEERLCDRTTRLSDLLYGMSRFCAGLAKKVLLGNTAGILWGTVRDLEPSSRTVVSAWVGLLCFTAQIYFDFSGYSDMAIGLGRLLGFKFPENFDYPYTAHSATDFWRRWHITLSTFFREYVYIPLGGSRKGRARTYFNLLVVWTLTGLWHGASWNFLLWGLYWFLCLTLEKTLLFRATRKLPMILKRLLTFLCVMLGWLIFVFDSSLPNLTLTYGFEYLKDMIGVGAYAFFDAADAEMILRLIPFALICAAASTPHVRRAFYKLYARRVKLASAMSAVMCPLILVLCVSFLLGSSYNPFLYFRF